MDRRNPSPLRSLPRVFLQDVDPDAASIELPASELQKLTKVLRLGSGDEIAVLPGDGRLLRCELQGREAMVLATFFPETEPSIHLTLCQALPRAEKLEEVVRMGTEIGVSRFVVFPSDRSVVRWDAAKLQDKLKRLASIAREAAEVAFRTRLPEIEVAESLATIMKTYPNVLVLSESENVFTPLQAQTDGHVSVAIGPEGGWSPREMKLIGDRGVTLGPRVLRVDTAAAAACSLILLSR